MPMGVPSEVPVSFADRHQFYQAVINQSKTLYSSTYTAQGLVDVIEMAAVIAGGMENLQKKPFFTTGINPSTPLRYANEVIAKLLVVARAGLPIVYNSDPMTGGTSPATLAGTIVMTVVEGLAGAILAQLINPGVPVIPGGGPGTMDMLTTVVGLGTPELGMMVAGTPKCSVFTRFHPTVRRAPQIQRSLICNVRLKIQIRSSDGFSGLEYGSLHWDDRCLYDGGIGRICPGG